MFGLQSQAEQAKRIILEAPDNTRRTYFVLLGTLLALTMHCILSYFGTENSWTCELDTQNSEYFYICRDLRKHASCRTLTGPLKAEVLLNINGGFAASAYIVCPWEIAITELRLFFTLGAVLCLVVGLVALSKEDRKLGELCLNSSYFFCLLLAIAATFDLYGIADSEINNQSFCELSEDYTLLGTATKEQLDCSYYVYRMTAYLGYVASAGMALSAYQMKNWKQNLSLDGL